MDAVLVKWGNGQALRISKEACNSLGIAIGAKAEVSIDEESSSITYQFIKPVKRYSRSRKISMEELMEDWEGGKAGEEWGGPDVGAEVVQ